MALNVQVYDGDGAAWDAFADSHPDSCNYHRYAWKNIIEKSFGHRSFYLTATNQQNEICGLLPLTHMKSQLFGNFLVSLPFFNYGGLLASHHEAVPLLLDGSRRMISETGADYAELRHLQEYEGNLATKQHKVTMILELANSEELQWKALSLAVKNRIRKAEKNGLRAITGHLELLDGFYEVFSRNMRDLGTPVYGKIFFRNILEAFPDCTRIISVIMGGRTIASGLMIWYRNTLEVPWASSIKEFREFCPNNLFYWEAIRFAIAGGVGRFDFGRSTPDEGTYRFKKSWGAKPQQMFWQYLLKSGAVIPELNPANTKYRLAIRMWQKLPVSLTRLLGPSIVRNIP